MADLPTLQEDQGATQHFKVLIRLRNSLVHSEPAFTPKGPEVPQRNRAHLEKGLSGKFVPCRMVSNSSHFIWAGCLGSGCAQWAVTTTLEFVNNFYKILGIPITSRVSSWEMTEY